MNEEELTHVIANSGDRHSLCGVKDAYPRVLVGFVQAHVAGHGMVVCSACAFTWLLRLVTP